MKKRNAVLLFICGMWLGISLALCLGATGKAANPPAKDWSRLKIVGFAGGTTGLFDPDTGRLYVYDIDLEKCFAIRELTTLGESMTRIKN